MLSHYLGKILKFKFIKNDTKELRKSYNIDTNETFIVTRLNDKPHNPYITNWGGDKITPRPHFPLYLWSHERWSYRLL